MDLRAIVGQIDAQSTQALGLGLFEDEEMPLSGVAANLDQNLRGAISELFIQGDFRAKKNETLALYTYGLIPAKRIVLVGLGKREAFSADTLRQAAASLAKKARELGVSELHVSIPEGKVVMSPATAAEAIAEGASLGLYRFTEFKTELNDQKPDPDRLVLVTPESDEFSEIEAGLRTGQIIAQSTALARTLVNGPSNVVTPSHMAQAAQEMAAASGLHCRILDKTTMEALGMRLLLSVNRGGDEPAQMVILEHNPGDPKLPTVVLVGKGITFDTGGISLKPSQNLEKMKGDMGGAAAVFGALRAAALLDVPLHVVGLTPLTENMPDARATKPGDVIRSLKGLTVEIINTDAEGRLILADTLTYAEEFIPDAILDVATLTGGRVIALGDHAAAVMGDDDLIEALRRAGERTGERVWPLPLFEAYGEQLKSEVADLMNVGGRAASTITAGFFLSKFVPDDIPWAHIDIAGLGLTDKAEAYTPKGGTGFGVRLFIELLRNWRA